MTSKKSSQQRADEYDARAHISRFYWLFADLRGGEVAAASLKEFLKIIDTLPATDARADILKELGPLVGSAFRLGIMVKTIDVRRAAAASARQAEGHGRRKELQTAKRKREEIIDRIAPRGPVRNPYTMGYRLLERVNNELAGHGCPPTKRTTIGTYLKKRGSVY
jgi:hypothetical protein